MTDNVLAKIVAAVGDGDFNAKNHEVVGSMHQKEYLDCMGEQGITREVVEAVARADANILNNAATAAGDLLVKKINEFKAAGDDPTGLSATVNITRTKEQGRMSVGVAAQKSFPNIQNPSDPIVKNGVISATVKIKAALNEDAAKELAEKVKAAIG